MEKIKRCPCCGSISHAFQDYTGWWHVQCTNCGLTTLKNAAKEDAIKVWNKREGKE